MKLDLEEKAIYYLSFTVSRKTLRDVLSKSQRQWLSSGTSRTWLNATQEDANA